MRACVCVCMRAGLYVEFSRGCTSREKCWTELKLRPRESMRTQSKGMCSEAVSVVLHACQFTHVGKYSLEFSLKRVDYFCSTLLIESLNRFATNLTKFCSSLTHHHKCTTSHSYPQSTDADAAWDAAWAMWASRRNSDWHTTYTIVLLSSISH